MEVLAFAGDDTVFVSPPGRYAEGRLVPRSDLEPDPRLEALRQGFVSWTHRLTGNRMTMPAMSAHPSRRLTLSPSPRGRMMVSTPGVLDASRLYARTP